MHALIGAKPLGDQSWRFCQKDVLAIKAEALCMKEKKYIVHDCILWGITEDKELGGVQFPDDLDYMPSWQSYVRANENNLNLQRLDCN